MHKEKILLGTSNRGKITEFLFYIKYFKIFQDFEIITLNSFPNLGEPEENDITFDGNASLKSSFFYSGSNLSCLSDDSGFIINESNNFPGVKTARLAKEKGGISGAVKSIFNDYLDLKEIPITFYCSLSLKSKNKTLGASGSINGSLISESRGEDGFGYDPYFIPENHQLTFSEMGSKKKMLVSHRYMAFKNLSLKLI
ncbi:MAG: non-canonical purine NTP pyrophosphatase [Proteobacteria bacterium]|nr:non-canonical purine NTP pyrophosphatase [Pseudomonadota bacterium]